MSYEFKKTEKVVNGIKHSVVLSEGELTYQVDIRENNIVVERFIQAKSNGYCRWHKRCSKAHELLCMPGEIMNDVHNLYEHFSAKLLAM